MLFRSLCSTMMVLALCVLSHSVVEGRLNVRGNALPRRRPTQKVRGLRRDLKSDEKIEKEGAEGQESTVKSRTAPKQIPTVARTSRNDVLKEIEKMKGETQLKNQSPSGGNQKSNASPKSSILKHGSDNNHQKKQENGVEHFQKGENMLYCAVCFVSNNERAWNELF